MATYYNPAGTDRELNYDDIFVASGLCFVPATNLW